MADTSIRISTNQGIEDVAAEEAVRLLGGSALTVTGVELKPAGLAGVVIVRISGAAPREGAPETVDAQEPLSDSALHDAVWRCLAHARAAYHVVIHIGEVAWRDQGMDQLAGEIAALPFTRMERAGSFRVSCSRSGEHPFHSPDVEAAVGAALQERYGTAVDLTGHDVNIRVDIMGSRCLCGYQLTGKKGLDRRYRWVYHPRVTLRTPVAFAMLDLCGFRSRPGDLYDPFCGSGTILLEAAGVCADAGVDIRDRPESDGGGVTIAGSDRSLEAVVGSRKNLDAAGAAGRVAVSRMDARDLREYLGRESLDYIVTNPPFGIRMGRNADLGSLYRQLLDNAAEILRPGGVLALLVGKRRGRFNKILQATPEFSLEQVRIIEIGGVYPGLFVLRRSAG